MYERLHVSLLRYRFGQRPHIDTVEQGSLIIIILIIEFHMRKGKCIALIDVLVFSSDGRYVLGTVEDAFQGSGGAYFV